MTKDGVTGTVAAGLPLASVPLGEIKSQDYETRDDLAVDVALNAVVPLESRRQVAALDAGVTELRLVGVGHGLAAGDVVALVGQQWIGLVVRSVDEDRHAGVTSIELDRALGQPVVVDSSAPPSVLAHPSLSLQPFGADADPTLFPPSALKAAAGTNPGRADAYWYTVQRADGGQYDQKDIYLSQQLEDRLAGGYVVRVAGDALAVLRVTGEAAAAVTFTHAGTESFATQKVAVTPQKGGGFLTELKKAERKDDQKLTLTNHVSGTVTALQVVDSEGHQAKRTDQPVPARWLGKWSVEAEVRDRRAESHRGREPAAAPRGPARTHSGPSARVRQPRRDEGASGQRDPGGSRRDLVDDVGVVRSGDAEARRGVDTRRPEGLRQRGARLARADGAGDARRL